LPLDAERSGHLFVQELRDAFASDAPDDLPDDVAECVRVVGDFGARLPPELCAGDRGAHLVPVAEVFDGRGQRNARHAGRVVEHLADRHAILATGGELGPYLGHRRVEVSARRSASMWTKVEAAALHTE